MSVDGFQHEWSFFLASGKENPTIFLVKTWTTDWFNQNMTQLTKDKTKTTDFSVKIKIIVPLRENFTNLTSDKAKTTNFSVNMWTTDWFSDYFTDLISESTFVIVASIQLDKLAKSQVHRPKLGDTANFNLSIKNTRIICN